MDPETKQMVKGGVGERTVGTVPFAFLKKGISYRIIVVSDKFLYCRPKHFGTSLQFWKLEGAVSKTWSRSTSSLPQWKISRL